MTAVQRGHDDAHLALTEGLRETRLLLSTSSYVEVSVRPLSLLLAPPLLFLAGCAALVVKPDDNAGEVTAKVFTRVLIGLPTLGMSELFIADERDKIEAKHELEEYRQSMTLMVNNGQLTPREAEELYLERAKQLADRVQGQRERRAQRVQAIGATMQGAGQSLQGVGPTQSYSAPPPVLPPPRRSTQCTSTAVGSTVYTNCN